VGPDKAYVYTIVAVAPADYWKETKEGKKGLQLA